MNLGNLVKSAVLAGAISLSAAQSANARELNLETLARQSQEVVINHPEQAQITNFRSFYLDLYERIQKLEFDFEQSIWDSRLYRRAMVHDIRDGVTKLLARYGVEFDISDSSYDNYVISMQDGFTIELSTSSGRGRLRFR